MDWRHSRHPSGTYRRRRARAAPGTTFTNFTDSGLSNALNVGGILATVTGANIQPGVNDTGIWIGAPGDLHLAVRNGDVVPDGSNTPLTVELLNISP